MFEKYLAAAQKETDPFLKPILIAALGHFRSPQLAQRALAIAVGSTFDARLTIRIFNAMKDEPGVDRLPYEFARGHYDELVAKLPSGIGMDYAATLPLFALSGGCSDTAREEAKQFFTLRMKNVQGGPRALANALEEIGLCAAQKPAAEKSIRDFLNKPT